MATSSIQRLFALASGSASLKAHNLRAKRKQLKRFLFELLEDRRLLATFEVTSLNDSGTGSLRQAIVDANSNLGLDEIYFNIAPGGQQTIQLASVLPNITDPIRIRGETQPGYTGRPLIGIDGSQITASSVTFAGLRLASGSDGSSINGLSVTSFAPTLVEIQSNDNLITNSFIGVGLDGAITSRQATNGLRVRDGVNNQLGGAAALGNLISGSYNNVVVDGTAATNNRIQGNRIGTNEAGDGAIAGSWGTFVSERGILVHSGASSTLIGGDNPGEGNLVSGHFGSSIDIYGAGNNQIVGNYVGTNAAGAARVGNFRGIVINSSPNNVIRNNLTSGNAGGIVVDGVAATNTTVQGNLVGTDQLGTSLIGNDGYGIRFMNGPSGALIGGTEDTMRNIIVGSGGDAISLNGSNFILQGNFIGVDRSGTVGLGNAGIGVYLSGATDSLIGGSQPGAGNVISANVRGISALGGAARNRVQGNLIGTSADGQSPLGNAIGISMNASDSVIGTDGDGVDDETEGNVIAASTSAGIGLSALDGTAGNILVAGNLIGFDRDGEDLLPNARGITIYSMANVQIGGATPAMRNVISGSNGNGVTGTGIYIQVQEEKRGVKIIGNYIGTDPSGLLARGNNYGVFLDRAAGVQIGGSTPAEANTISGNHVAGVFVTGIGADNNSVIGNFLGTTPDGMSAVAGNQDGVYVGSLANGNRIGGTEAGQANVISGNKNGIWINVAHETTIQNNFIGTDRTGNALVGNTAAGVLIVGARDTQVGGANLGEGNTISGNLRGVYLNASASSAGATTGTSIQGNQIGTNTAGTEAIPNMYGVHVAAPSWWWIHDTLIGGAEDDAGNLISGNTSHGVWINGSRVLKVDILGNQIGTDSTGQLALANQSGIFAENLAGSVQVGAPGAGNLISGNLQSGVVINGTAQLTKSESFNFQSSAAASEDWAIGTGWSEFASRTSGDNFGFSPTNFAGGAANFEAGGTIGRDTDSNQAGEGVAYYADQRLAGTLDFTDAINASGRLQLSNPRAWDQPFAVGYFQRETAEAQMRAERMVLEIAPRLDSSTHFQATALIRFANGTELRGESVNGLVGLAFDQSYAWEMAYAPANGIDSQGEFEIAVYSAGTLVGTSRISLTVGQRQAGVELDAFGLLTEDGPSIPSIASSVDFYMDDLVYSRAVRNQIMANSIGVNADGSSAIPNALSGVALTGVTGTVLGGSDPAQRNTISGNVQYGIRIEGGSANRIQGNYIGTNRSGTAAIANATGLGATPAGIYMAASSDNIVGGGELGAGNLISGNNGYGLRIDGTAGSHRNLVQSNLIGTDASGSFAVANDSGVYVGAASTNNMIGVDGDGLNDASEGNLISGNIDPTTPYTRAISIRGASNVVAGNKVGTDLTGAYAIANSFGVRLDRSANSRVGTNADGRSDELERNWIAGNIYEGVEIGDTSYDNVVAGNWIGLNVAGDPLSNGGGVVVAPGSLGTPQRNRIGTNADGIHDEAERNVISGNREYGIRFINLLDGATGVDRNVVAGNLIGVGVGGATFLANDGPGVRIEASSGQMIGGHVLGAGNVIAANTGDGVEVRSGSGNTIRGNSIYANGGLGIDLTGDGVTSNDLRDNDTGANDLQNIPQLSMAAAGNTTRVAGILHSVPLSTYALDFYANAALDPSGYGEGQRWLGSGQVTTDADGSGSFEITLTSSTTNTERITATSTNANGSTSEFSLQWIANASPIAQAVTNSKDTGVGSLRQAIEQANLTSGSETVDILFGLHTVDPNYIDIDAGLTGGDPSQDVFRILPLSPLPAITRGHIRIDGDSQRLVGGDKNSWGPEIVLDGSTALAATTGLVITSDSNEIRGLNFQRFAGAGLEISGDNNLVASNLIGTDATGTFAAGNGQDGIRVISGGTNNRIGGEQPGQGNVLSGNLGVGLVISGNLTANNVVQGNRIGTDAVAVRALANSRGIDVSGAPGTLIGGTSEGARNIISGNTGVGVSIYGAGAIDTQVQGNWIGLDGSGTGDLGNAFQGIYVGDGQPYGVAGYASNTSIGGETAGAGNVISGNNQNGIWISGTGATGNTIQGNLVGTDITGTLDVGNTFQGIRIERSSGNQIGGTSAAARNVLSGNNINGLWIRDDGADDNIVEGNYIGTDITGTKRLGNSGWGIWLSAAERNRVGGSAEGAGNLVSGNLQGGIGLLASGTLDNVLQGNRVGTDRTGTLALGNGNDGIAIGEGASTASFLAGAPQRTIVGGSAPNEGNLISGNVRGVTIFGALAANNELRGNKIGTDATGQAAIPNSTYGVYLTLGAHDNTIGTNADGIGDLSEGNLISGNNSYGVYINGAGIGNRIAGNLIGTDASGQLPLRNYHGVDVTNTAYVTIGGGLTGERNVISGNAYNLRLSGSATHHTTVQGNLIGLSADGRQAVTNGWLTQTNDDGIVIQEGSHSNLIGGPNPEDGNVIGGHWEQGIWIFPGGSDNNLIENNFIGTNIDGSVSIGNVRGIFTQASSGNVLRDNVLSGNVFNVEMRGPASGNVIAGNRIGTNSDGSTRVQGGTNSRGISLNLGIVGTLIGGSNPADRNLISGNGIGIYGDDAPGTRIENNHVGTNLAGDATIANTTGLHFLNTPNLRVGGPETAQRNLISGNTSTAVMIQGENSRNARLQNNFIGVDASGNVALPNGNGVTIDAASNNWVGTDGDGINDDHEGNLISGNSLASVYIVGGASDNVVAGNLVGTDRSGRVAIPGSGGLVIYFQGSRNRIGTNADGVSDEAERNVVVAGVSVALDPLVPSVMEDNVIAGNYIGVDITGENAFGVGQVGINIGFTRAANSPDSPGPLRTVIGGTTEVERNIISGFRQYGIAGNRAVETRIQGNYIGTDATGTRDLGNLRGIQFFNSPGTIIGGGEIGAGNLISGNEYGVWLAYPQSTGSKIQGNKVGTDLTGTVMLANTYHGVEITNGASSNIIGVDGDGLNDGREGNIVSGNLNSGIRISGDHNVIAGNWIGVDATGTVAIPNGHGVALALANENRIGTNADGVSDELERNIISGNTGLGVGISSSPNQLVTTNGNVVAGNYIGTDITGSMMLGNGWRGVSIGFSHGGAYLAPPTGNRIGGLTSVERNVIAGHRDYGVLLDRAMDTQILGNYIGTSADGSQAFPNATGLGSPAAGIYVSNSSNTQIGGGHGGSRNVISGNNGYGIQIIGALSTNNRVQGNFIGTDATGRFAVPNDSGIYTDPFSSKNIIGVDGDGNDDAMEGNVISGNVSADSAYARGAWINGFDQVFAGNIVGLDVLGTFAVGNSFGVLVAGDDSRVGTNADGVSDELERNYIAGNQYFGLEMNYGASGNRVGGNWIGLNRDANTVPNGGGINIGIGAGNVPRNNLIGSNADGVFDTAERNVISGNRDFGIRFTGSTATSNSDNGNVVAGNFIGIDPSGTRALPNRQVSTNNMGDGIQIWNGATGITIGGTHPAARNVISGNEGSGIDINQSSNVVILGNYIGTDATGSSALGNHADGISVTSRFSSGPTTGTIIGGIEPGASNVISGNTGNGITVLGSKTNFTQIVGNVIGVDVTRSITLGNTIGVRIEQGASNNLIGGTQGDASNVIAGNRSAGIHIVGADVLNNVVQGNFIGTDRSARRALANQHGIVVQQTASTTIGGEFPELGNTVAYNSSAGLWLVDSPAASAPTRNNRVFHNAGLGIDLGALGPTLNDPGDVDDLLNYPVITLAVVDEFNLTISGFARPGAWIDFYRSVPTLNSMGQGDLLLASFQEGSLQDSDLESGSYGPNVSGVPVGSDSTHRFRFSIPLSLLPSDIGFGTLLTALAIGSTSEYSNAIPIGDLQTGIAPVVNLGLDQELNQGQWLVINGTFTDDDSTSWSATVDYGDGIVEPLALRADRSFTLQHQYAMAGQYQVTVWVVDNSQAVGSDQLQVTVVNEAPTATFNLFTITSPAMEGSTVTLRGEFTDPGLNDIHEVEIDWGDNSPIQLQMIPQGERRFEVTHVYVDDDPTGTPRDVYRVQVTVVDNLGGRDSTPLGLFLEDVINVAPENLIVTPSAPMIDENSTGFSLSGSFFDPGALDNHQVTIDWGDGSAKQIIDLSLGARGFSNIAHVYRDNPDTSESQYLIRIEVADDDEPLRPAVAVVPITVRNVLPYSLAISASATTISENDTIYLSGSFLDSGPFDTHRVEIDWGDGSTEAFALSAGDISFSNIAHHYRDNAEGGSAYTISVRVMDDDQPDVGVAATTLVAVSNLPPSLHGIASNIHGVVREGDWVTVSGTYADTGSHDRHVVEIFWGDGTSSLASVDSKAKSFVATHQLIDDNPTDTALDTTHIRVVITDDDGDRAEQLLPISIANVPPTVDIRPGANSTQALVELIADVHDPGVADEFTYHWEVTVAGNTVSTLGGSTYLLDRTGRFNDVFVVRLTVSDDDTGSTVLTTALKVGTPLSDNIVVTDSDFNALGVNDMIVLGLASTDVIDATAVSAGNRVRLDGGTGDDRLFGGAGDDIYFLRGGDDSANLATIVGDPVPVYAGADRYFLVPNSTQRVADYEGSNAIDFSLADFGITFDLSADSVLQDVDPTGDVLTHFVWVEGSFDELVGSAFSDSLTADTDSTVLAGAGSDLLRIDGNTITNVLLAGGDGNDRFVLAGSNLSSIRARGDDGADLAIIEGTLDDLVFTGGADDDEVRLLAAAIVQSLEIRGDDGADLAIIEGTLDDLVFTGGADDDRLRIISAAQSIRFQGDDGADLAIIEGTLEDLVFTGGADIDQLQLLDSSVVGSIEFRGDDGADLAIIEGTLEDLVFTGGADNDQVRLLSAAVVNSFEFRGDDGADLAIIEGTLEDLVFTGGADDDELRIISAARSILFRGDDGADLAIIEGTLEDLVFTGGADDDQLQLLGSSVVASIEYLGDDGADLAIIEGTLDDLVFTGGADDDLLRTMSSSQVQRIRYQGDDGADLAIVEGTLDDLVFTGGADDDFLRALSSARLGAISYRGDDGADLAIIEGTLDDLVFTGGADDDRLRTTTTSTVRTALFQGDDGADLAIVEGTLDDLVFTGGADNDRLLMSVTARTQAFAFNGDDGADLAIIEGTLDDLVFTGGADDDQLLIEPSAHVSRVRYFGDDGADLMIVEGTLDDVVFTGGADHDRLIAFTGGQGTIDFYGEAADAVGVSNGSRDVLYNLGHGWTAIRMHAAANGSVLQNRGNQIEVVELLGRQGPDALINYGSQISHIIMQAGDGSDLLINDASNVTNIEFDADGFNGEKTLINYGSYAGEQPAAIVFRGGNQIDAFQNNGAGYALLNMHGSEGGDTFQNNAAGIQELFFDGGAGDDVFENNGTGVQKILFEGGQGDDIVANDGDYVLEATFWSGHGQGLFINTGSETGQITYYGSAGHDTFLNQGQNATSIVMFGGAGDDRMINTASGGRQLTMVGDDGDDTFYNLASAIDTEQITFNAGQGNNRFLNQASQLNGLTFTAADGNDLFQSSGTAIADIQIFVGDGTNTVRLEGSDISQVSLTGGRDNDTAVVDADTLHTMNFMGHDGIDLLLLNADRAENVHFYGGVGYDALAINGQWASSIYFYGEEGPDRLQVLGANLQSLSFIGGAGDDAAQLSGVSAVQLLMSGDDGNDLLFLLGDDLQSAEFIGGNGLDTLISSGNRSGTIRFEGGPDADTLRTAGMGLHELVFLGGSGSDGLVMNHMSDTSSTVKFEGGLGDEMVAIRGRADSIELDLGEGHDLVHLSGDGHVTASGGSGDDHFVLTGSPTGTMTIDEFFTGSSDNSRDLIDLSGLHMATSSNQTGIRLDLLDTAIQQLTDEFGLRLTDSNGIEDVIGTLAADTILGNDRDNHIQGAQYQRMLPFTGTVAKRNQTQWVLLDFDTYTQSELGEYSYSAEDRQTIAERIGAAFQASDETSPWLDVRITLDQGQIPPETTFTTIYFNETPTFGRPGGEASEIDFLNRNEGGFAVVQVNGLLGGLEAAVPANEDFVQQLPEDADLAAAGSRKPPATRENILALSSKIATHELGHLLGLMHADAFGPIGFGIHAPPGALEFTPEIFGPAVAFETLEHLIGSPGSVGSTRYNDIGQLFFGERESIKLALAAAQLTTLVTSESTLDHGSRETAQPLQLKTLPVPQLSRAGINAGKTWDVRAVVVAGSIELQNQVSESDIYAIEGFAGQVLSIEVFSQTLAHLQGDTIDPVVRLFDEAGQLVAYFDGVAVNDDQFEGSESRLIDVRLPSDGVFYIEVDTFRRASEDPLCREFDAQQGEFEQRLLAACGDRDTGGYELLIYSFATFSPTDGIDTLLGRGGVDVLNGGPNDDYALRVQFPSEVSVEEGISSNLVGVIQDRGGQSWSGRVNYGDGTGWYEFLVDASGTFSLVHSYPDNGTYHLMMEVNNDDQLGGMLSTIVDVANLSPVLGDIIAPTQPVVVSTPISTGLSFSDPGVNDSHEVQWDWGDGIVSAGTVSGAGGSYFAVGSHSYALPGIYRLKATVTDDDGAISQQYYDYIVVIGQSGSVTGAAILEIPNVGAATPTLVNISNSIHSNSSGTFGDFRLRLLQEQTLFDSTLLDWLVLNGSTATYSGRGVLNGVSGYSYLVSVFDAGQTGQPDRVRVKIWKELTGEIWLDTQIGAADFAAPLLAVRNGNILVKE